MVCAFLKVVEHPIHRSALAALDVYRNIPKAQFGRLGRDLGSHRFAYRSGKLRGLDLEPQKILGMKTRSDIVESLSVKPAFHGLDPIQSTHRYDLTISDPAG
jgi:hypothetical protein